jgi:phenylalanyl-tRNA synthetase beta chain
MKLSENWLREWVSPEVTTEQLADQLTAAGLEVEGIEAAAANFTGVVIAEIQSVEAHPDADKLRVCQVNTGDETVQIVTNVATVKSGDKVPLAKLGAVLPGDFKIKPAKLRGVESQGMFCGAETLGFEKSEGLYNLPADAPVGQDIREYLQLNDQIIEIGLTPNRGDCLSVLGVARDVCAVNNLEPVEFSTEKVAAQITDEVKVELVEADACPRYLGRVIKGIKTEVESPVWLTEKLRRAGVKAISPVVDALNLVMLEIGQPMHAFDFNKLSGDIEVRYARDSEKLQLLDEQEVELRDNTLVIADASGPLAIAGVMGGLAGSVTTETRDIFLECAYFNPVVIAGKARSYGLTTDASHRYERGVDFNLPVQAIEKATALIQSLVGGEAGPVTDVTVDDSLPDVKTIEVTVSRINKLLGLNIGEEEIVNIFKYLGFKVDKNSGESLLVTVPSYRFDLAIPEDLAEEVLRIHGYDKVVAKQFIGEVDSHIPGSLDLTEDHFKTALKDMGYNEAITYSFVASKQQQAIDPDSKAMELANPISQEMAVMRTSLWPGLLGVLKYNLHRQQSRAKLFELGQRFCFVADELQQEQMIAGLLAGDCLPEQWGQAGRKFDFFDLKGDVEQLLGLSMRLEEFDFVTAEHPALHPGQSAKVLLNNELVGWIGALHPSLLKTFGLKASPFLFELNLQRINRIKQTVYQEVSKFPVVRRDFAILVDENVTSSCLQKVIAKVAGDILVDTIVFDVFTGGTLAVNQKSVAIGLLLQHQQRTLKDDEVTEISEQIISALSREYGAKLRE